MAKPLRSPISQQSQTLQNSMIKTVKNSNKFCIDEQPGRGERKKQVKWFSLEIIQKKGFAFQK